MGKTRSFKKYITDNFLAQIDENIEEYFTEHPDCIDAIKLCKIKTIEYDESQIIKIGIDNLPGDNISFQILVKSCFWATGKSSSNDDDEEEISQWFTINCKGDISKNLKDFAVLDISIYDEKLSLANPLSDNLVPIIYKAELDEFANSFLKKYYPEALTNPIPINPKKIVDIMGLKVKQHTLSIDCTVFGTILFDDCSIEVFDKGTPQVKNFSKGTILVDPQVFYLRNVGSFFNTIIHECVHWELHKKAFELERIYNKDANKIKCLTNGNIKSASSDNSKSFIEWQANSITPRIQAPKEMLLKKFKEYCIKYDATTTRSLLLNSIEQIIDDIARDFNISRQSTKIRLIECGVNIARGAFIYVDNHYIKPVAFNKNSLAENEIFAIGIEDLIIQGMYHPKLKGLIEKGKLVYIDSFLCINNLKFIKKYDLGYYELTEYARQHIDECCLKFDIKISGRANSNYLNKECILCRDINTGLKYSVEFNKGINDDIILQIEAILENGTLINEGLDCIFNSLSKSLKALMKWVDISEAKLSDKSGLTEKTIQRIRTEQSINPHLSTIIALCIGLELPYKVSLAFLDKAGLSLKTNSTENMLFNFFISDGCNFDIYQCDELLRAKGCNGFIKY